MADTLTSNPLVLDLNDATERQVSTRRLRILNVTLSGTKAAASIVRLRQDSATTGAIVWQFKESVAASTDFHENDAIDVPVDNLFLEVTSALDASSVLLVYYA